MKQTTDLSLSKSSPLYCFTPKTQFGSTPTPIDSYQIMSEPSHIEVPENYPHACTPNPYPASAKLRLSTSTYDQDDYARQSSFVPKYMCPC